MTALRDTPETRALRSRLQAITETMKISEHKGMLDDLTLECPNTIEPMESEQPLNEYNCVKFALSLHKDRRCLEIQKRAFKTLAGTDFAQWLIDTGVLTEVDAPSATAPADEKICAYFEGSKLVHVGLAMGNLIRSKWGVGYFYQHQIFEVPECYGNAVRFFNSPDSCGEAFQWFERWLFENGWSRSQSLS